MKGEWFNLSEFSKYLYDSMRSMVAVGGDIDLNQMKNIETLQGDKRKFHCKNTKI